MGLWAALPILWVAIALPLHRETFQKHSILYRFGICPHVLDDATGLGSYGLLHLTNLVSALFVHASLYQAGLNAAAFAVCARGAERRTGAWFCLLLVGAGIAGNLAHWRLNTGLDRVAVGATALVAFCTGWATFALRSIPEAAVGVVWLLTQMASPLPATIPSDEYTASYAYRLCGGTDWRATVAAFFLGAIAMLLLTRAPEGADSEAR